MPPPNFSDLPGISFPNQSTAGTSQLMSGVGVPGSNMDGMMDNTIFATDEAFSWELISLGLEEPLPSQDIIDDLCVYSNHLASLEN
jgi:hypothetical protein